MRGTDHLPEGAVGDFMLIDRDPRLEPSSGWFLKGVLLLPGAYPGNAHFGYAEWDQEYMPYLPGVKLVSDTPVTTLWDRHTAPEGWEVLYTGVAYAGYEWIAAPICVDFEVQNATVLGSVMNFNFVTSQGVYGYDDTGAFVATDCVVVRKRP
ncbi:MAG: hypothetical protein EP330_18385 [Deltaproteobacteria bacterium]|nr:MAG: hypothetical protein EP330_18385 [Deltaproteobacteria bacterium]